MKNSYVDISKAETRVFLSILLIIASYVGLLVTLFYVVKTYYSLDLYNSVYLLGQQCMDFARNLLLVRFGWSSLHVFAFAATAIFFIRGIGIAVINHYRTYAFVSSLQVSDVTDRYIRVKSDEPLAFTYGLFWQKIYVSDWYFKMLDGNELEAVITHEESHVRSRDNLKKAVIRWFNYSLPYLSGRILSALDWYRLSEAKADAYVVQTLGSNKPLLSAMLKVSNSTFRFNSKLSLNYFCEDSEVSRAQFLTDKVAFKVGGRKIAFAILLPAILAGFLFFERNLVFANDESNDTSLINVIPGRCKSITLPGYKSDEKLYSPAVNQSFR